MTNAEIVSEIAKTTGIGVSKIGNLHFIPEITLLWGSK